MSSLVFLVPISIALLGAAIWAFIWAVRRGQFDDLETPAIQILVDEPDSRPESQSGRAPDGRPGTGTDMHTVTTPPADRRAD